MTEPLKQSIFQRTYWAFISYSHRDAAWGEWLHKRLENYRVPHSLSGKPSRDDKIPRRLFPVFRDREELPVSADLGANIRNCLQNSRYLIVICSRFSAKSRWVEEEVRYFKALGREDHILCAIIDGEPNASDRSDRDAEECFPAAIRFQTDSQGQLTTERTEPVAADLRKSADGKRKGALKIIAGLLGVNFDELQNRERRRTIRRICGRTLFGLSVVSLLVGSFVLEERIRIEQGQRALVQNHLENGQAQVTSGKLSLALAEFAKAFELQQKLSGSTDALRNLLLEASKSLGQEVRTLAIAESSDRKQWMTFAAFSPDGNKLATASWDGTIQIWDLLTGTRTPLARESSRALCVNFSADGTLVVGSFWNGTAKIWNVDGKLLATLAGHSGRINYAVFSPDGTKIVTASDDSTAVLWQIDGRKIRTFIGHTDLVKSAVFAADGTKVLTASFDGTAKLWDAESGTLILTIDTKKVQQGELNFAVISPDGTRIVTVGLTPEPVVWDMNGNQITKILGHNKERRINHVAFNPAGTELITASDDGTAKVWDVKDWRLTLSLERHKGKVLSATFNRQGTLIATTSDDGTAKIWSALPPELSPEQIVAMVGKG
jgi:WD40 repeat protein